MAEKWTDDKMPSGRAIPRIPQKETGPHGNRERSPDPAGNDEGKEAGKVDQQRKRPETDACDDDRFQATDN